MSDKAKYMILDTSFAVQLYRNGGIDALALGAYYPSVQESGRTSGTGRCAGETALAVTLN